MAYRVWIGSTPIDCDSPDAAVELARRIEGDSATPRNGRNERTPQATASIETTRWTTRRVDDFFKLIDGSQKKIIDILIEHTDGRTDQQLMGHLSFTDGRALGGVFGGLYKNAKKVGADPEDLYVRKPTEIAGRKVSEYFLKDSFRKAVEAWAFEK